jgi:hypothetical protein
MPRKHAGPANVACPVCGGDLGITLPQSKGEPLSPLQHEATLSSQILDALLWAGIRVLQESSELDDRLASLAQMRGNRSVAGAYRNSCRSKRRTASRLRELVLGLQSGAT